ncbi:hypothetical protein CYY_001779 [Polysphondylium violaceum]|uniref:FNIP repeat-containing protein n=1 Tax=Polysphondylium violaceum TaxID=133409 RepID=A0A8J4PZL4_9MYCE|nr:hypothetical protein CYY_001779 [Polysphondylium violaceum]
MIESFYLIWRNLYIRSLIRNRVCKDVLLKVDKEYLEENRQYLALLTNRDKQDHNISIHFRGDVSDYLDIKKSNRDMINDADLKTQEDFNFNEIHDGVRKLRLTIKCPTASGMGQLPDSMMDLTLISDFDKDGYPPAPIIKHLFSNLPCKLQRLSLYNNDGCIQSTCVLPQSLTDLSYEEGYSGLKWLVVPPNKVYKNCTLDLDSVKSYQWLLENKFICNVNIQPRVVPRLKSHQLPSHVTDVNLDYGLVVPDLFLPHTVERLSFSTHGTPFSHITNLKLLHISGDYVIKLDKGVLPRSLESLCLCYNQPLELDVLPQTLTSFHLYRYNQPLRPNVLPPSLTYLALISFDQPLDANVLPRKLKILTLLNFNQPTFFANSLPVSLTRLYLDAFKGSFDQCQPLDNLNTLRIDSLVPSLSTLLANVKRLDLYVKTRISEPSGIACLFNTSIESLHLSATEKSTLYPNIFPPTIKYLSLNNVVIESDNVIPNNCRYLKSSDSDIDPKFIPQSARYLKSIQ